MESKAEQLRAALKQLIDQLPDDKVELILCTLSGIDIGIAIADRKGA